MTTFALALAAAPVRDVHTAHCCAIHGCTYLGMTVTMPCTVVSGRAPQEYRCETCDDEIIDFWDLAHAMNALYDRAYTLGNEAGYDRGREAGLTDGREAGYDSGYEAGRWEAHDLEQWGG